MFTKKNVSLKEYTIYQYIYSINIVNTPKPISYDKATNIMTMEKIPQLDISNMYGDSPNDIPEYIFDEIRKIITKLYDHNIIYPDITGYNFIEYDNKIWIIDFEHCECMPEKTDPFVFEFINGKNEWNPSFK